MQRRLIILIGILMVTPAAAAWSVRGSTEPNTAYDQKDGYMPLDTPQSLDEAARVYFNGWLSPSYIEHTSLNPNLGTVAGVSMNTNVAPVITVPWALLGVWMDCNKDGYIGNGDGQFEYPTTKVNGQSVFGVDETLCPVKAITKFPDQRGEQPEIHGGSRGLVHNDGRWIHEFIPIGWNQHATMWNADDEQNQYWRHNPLADKNPWDLNDTSARVWMDFGLPDSSAPPAGGFRCWYLGYPRGTLHSTGGIIGAHDCYINFRVTDTLNSLSPVLDGPGRQITFNDSPRNHRDSRSVLNQQNPWGDEKDGSYVQPWDCSSPPRNVDNPATTDQDWLFNVSMPRVPPGGAEPNPSPAGTVNETGAGIDQCNRSPKNSTGNTPYFLEGDLLNSAKKIQPSNTMIYESGFRRQGPQSTAWAPISGGGAAPGTPSDFGLRITGFEGCASPLGWPVFVAPCYEGIWHGNTQSQYLEGRLINRDTAAISPVGYQTFYAFVGPTVTATFGLKLPDAGQYGSQNCALPPEEQLFECNPAKWWPGESMARTSILGPDPNDDPHRCGIGTYAETDRCYPIGVRPGQAFQLRDIDCTDHSADPLRNEGIHYGVLTQTACKRAT